jgi:hypothetical protein
LPKCTDPTSVLSLEKRQSDLRRHYDPILAPKLPKRPTRIAAWVPVVQRMTIQGRFWPTGSTLAYGRFFQPLAEKRTVRFPPAADI